MREITDRGIAMVQPEADGSKTVMVCFGVQNGEPQDVFAVHSNRQRVVVHQDVSLNRTAGAYYTDGMVEVSSDSDGVVHIRGPRAGRGIIEA
jgi:hypothetical protein